MNYKRGLRPFFVIFVLQQTKYTVMDANKDEMINALIKYSIEALAASRALTVLLAKHLETARQAPIDETVRALAKTTVSIQDSIVRDFESRFGELPRDIRESLGIES